MRKMTLKVGFLCVGVVSVGFLRIRPKQATVKQIKDSHHAVPYNAPFYDHEIRRIGPTILTLFCVCVCVWWGGGGEGGGGRGGG